MPGETHLAVFGAGYLKAAKIPFETQCGLGAPLPECHFAFTRDHVLMVEGTSHAVTITCEACLAAEAAGIAYVEAILVKHGGGS